MDLSIIIINWNSKDYVAACLRSVFEHAPSVPFEVIVLDSGSFDGCGEMIACNFPMVRFIQSSENLGFARANNLAITQARGSTFLFLNPDTEVQADAANRLYHVASQPRAGAVGAHLLNTDGTLQTSCVQAFPTILNQVLISDALIRFFPTLSLWGKAALFQYRADPQEVEAVSGAAIMIRKEVFKRIGGFCEEYFMYSEDIDLCFQARQVGFRNLYVPNAWITHHGGGSSSSRTSRFAATMKVAAVRHYLARNRSFAYACLYRVSLAVCATGRLILLFPPVFFAHLTRRTSPANHAYSKWQYILQWAYGAADTFCSDVSASRAGYSKPHANNS